MIRDLFANDTIVAQATAVGKAGVGIVRISGNKATEVAHVILGKQPNIRQAEYLPFKDTAGNIIDQGIAIFFQTPYSFTGEDVLELQGHGGQIILDLLLKQILMIDGVRLAKPGEFSERAFLNNKLDLAQAEAIADLINADSEQAALSAVRSLQGEFSQKINQLVTAITDLRTYIEAAIDFVDEEIDFLSQGKVQEQLQSLISQVTEILSSAQQGSILREGMKIVIAGKPNAGKSSLLNLLAAKDVAIVSNIAGTTRDVLQEYINIDGMPLHIIDTAGLRTDTDDEIEKIGITKAWSEIKQANMVLLVVDASECPVSEIDKVKENLLADIPNNIAVTVIYNKIDMLAEELPVIFYTSNGTMVINFSMLTRQGLTELQEHLKNGMGYQQTEGVILARRRHLEALTVAAEKLTNAYQILSNDEFPELVAEDLRMAQQSLAEITGKFTSDDLLTQIFSSFCIGK